jgi:thiamine-phosphate pyrophosphorylase
MAIGGIDLHNLPEVLKANVRSVGVVRALMASPDLDAAVAEWKAALARD